MYHYVYRLDHIETGEFYIGSRSSNNHPKIDKYMGSMVTWKPDKTKLIKTILKDDFENREEAIFFESKQIEIHIKNKLNRNYNIPNCGFNTHGIKISENHKNKISKANSIVQKGSGNSQYGTCFIHSMKYRKSIRVKKEYVDSYLNDGWEMGRIIDFDKAKIRKEKEISKKRRKEEKIKKYSKWYKIYKEVGFYKFCEITGYDKSKPNLVQMFSKYVKEFKPQNGKYRGNKIE